MMTGIMLISANNKYADDNGGLSWGPKSDKEWVRAFIEDKVVFVGYNTYQTVKNLKVLAPSRWVFNRPSFDTEVHFGGYKSLWKFPPERLILHKTRESIDSRRNFKLPPGYVRVSRLELPDYTEIIYERRGDNL